MKAVGHYLLFVTSLAGMSLSNVDDFDNETNQKEFLTHILNFHNSTRKAHGLPELKRIEPFDMIAHTVIQNKLFSNINMVPSNSAIDYFLGNLDDETKLNNTFAEYVFSIWNNKETINSGSKISNGEAYNQIMWVKTKYIGLAIGRKDKNFVVLVTYNPRYYSPTIDQGEPSTT